MHVFEHMAFILFLFFLSVASQTANNRPVIGIITQPAEGTNYALYAKSLINSGIVFVCFVNYYK